MILEMMDELPYPAVFFICQTNMFEFSVKNPIKSNWFYAINLNGKSFAKLYNFELL